MEKSTLSKMVTKRTVAYRNEVVREALGGLLTTSMLGKGWVLTPWMVTTICDSQEMRYAIDSLNKLTEKIEEVGKLQRAMFRSKIKAITKRRTK